MEQYTFRIQAYGNCQDLCRSLSGWSKTQTPELYFSQSSTNNGNYQQWTKLENPAVCIGMPEIYLELELSYYHRLVELWHSYERWPLWKEVLRSPKDFPTVLLKTWIVKREIHGRKMIVYQVLIQQRSHGKWSRWLKLDRSKIQNMFSVENWCWILQWRLDLVLHVNAVKRL